MSTEQIEQHVRDFLTNNFIFDPTVRIDRDDSLMENGIVDSTGVLEVIMWVEATFDIKVEDAEVLPENFDSIRSLTHYTKYKLSYRPAVAS